MKRLLHAFILSSILLTTLSANTFLNVGYSNSDFKYLTKDTLSANPYVFGFGSDYLSNDG